MELIFKQFGGAATFLCDLFDDRPDDVVAVPLGPGSVFHDIVGPAQPGGELER